MNINGMEYKWYGVCLCLYIVLCENLYLFLCETFYANLYVCENLYVFRYGNVYACVGTCKSMCKCFFLREVKGGKTRGKGRKA